MTNSTFFIFSSIKLFILNVQLSMLKYSVGPWTKELRLRALHQHGSASCSDLTTGNFDNKFSFDIKSLNNHSQSFNESQSLNANFSFNSNTVFDVLPKNVKRFSNFGNVAQSFKNKLTKTWYF